jgi:hypothetical protein
LISIKLATVMWSMRWWRCPTRPGGFTLAQVAEAVQQRARLSTKAYSARNAAYDLAKLKGKKLVHCVKGSRRYKADPSGVRAMFAYLILRDKVIKPLLAGVVRPFGRPKSKPPSISTTSGFARSSTEPLKLSGLRRLEKLARERQHVVVRCSISA